MSQKRSHYGKFRNFNFGDFSFCVDIQKRVEYQNNDRGGLPTIDFETKKKVRAFWEDLEPIQAVGQEGSDGGVVAKNIKNACITIPYMTTDIFKGSTWIKHNGIRYRVDSVDDTDKKRRYLKLFLIEQGDENLIGSKT